MSWFRRMAVKFSVGSRLVELTEFSGKAASASDRELGMLVALATKCRVIFEKTSGLSLLQPSIALQQNPLLALEIGSHIKSMQSSGSLKLAAGMMVWLHTVRAAEESALAPAARELWNELIRGYPFATEALAQIDEYGPRIEIEELFLVPDLSK